MKKQKDNWESVEMAYNAAHAMSCRPDASFKCVQTGMVLDEEKSVRWNREEVERLKGVYSAEVKRLTFEKNLAIQAATKRTIRLLATDLGVSEEKAGVLWDFIYAKHHAFGDMFRYIDEYEELIRKMLA